MNTILLSKEELLIHWQGHRALTRKTIEAFPEKELFEFAIGNMRPFSVMVHEILAIGVPGLQEIVSKETAEFKEHTNLYKTKDELLAQWDHDTAAINSQYALIPETDFRVEFNLFGQYKNSAVNSILYFIDNEVHHRAQAFVYLRALNMTPPFFWER
ncbi:DinB family protein [Flavobacterium sp. HSC-61S13]|uniref:DinB family protein n=1 Tax=Flavobacterium sp. HSC-61S13 TaxID=2910963 RepID=UPI00209D4958|nr:DinB family protein [Flavobacterium sp. HSC-61S13]MCP1996022.1 putative damage-inducible protein DinB [Flavobacterium sp. HSC-61S13]